MSVMSEDRGWRERKTTIQIGAQSRSNTNINTNTTGVSPAFDYNKEKSQCAALKKELSAEVHQLLRTEKLEFLIAGSPLEKVSGKSKNVHVIGRLAQTMTELEFQEPTALHGEAVESRKLSTGSATLETSTSVLKLCLMH